MVMIRIHPNAPQNEIEELEEKWLRAKSATIDIAPELSEEDIVKLYMVWRNRLPSSLAYSVLSLLVEDDSFPSNLLAEAYQLGDTGVKVAICLRNSIPDDLREICLRSDEIEVVEHVVFRADISKRECESLLETPIGAKASDAIRRAIELKKT